VRGWRVIDALVSALITGPDRPGLVSDSVTRAAGTLSENGRIEYYGRHITVLGFVGGKGTSEF
jgi:hypothetical protein